MSDHVELHETFGENNTFFQIACQDVLRIVSILSLDSTDVTRPRNKQSLWKNYYERIIFLGRFFYMVFIKGFTPTVFDVLPYTVWKILTTLIYVYRLVLLPFWLRLTGYGRFADWRNLGNKQPPKAEKGELNEMTKVYSDLSLTRKERLSKLNFGEEEYERLIAKLIELSTHLSPHSQSPGNPFTHLGFPGNFFNHLTGVYKILLAWQQPRYVCRGGLFHSVYGTFDYRFSLFDLRDGRQALTDVVGEGAEELAFALCTSDRLGLMTDLLKSMYGADAKKGLEGSLSGKKSGEDEDRDGNPYPPRINELSPLGYPVRNHITQEVHVLPPDFFAQFIIVTIADFMEQGAVGFGSADLDICIFQFMRFRFYNDLIMYVRPYLRAVPPVWLKYMGNQDFIEPTREEVVCFKQHWKAMLEQFLSSRQTGTTVRYQYTSISKASKILISRMVKKYPYLAEPKIFIATTLAANETHEGSTRTSLAAAGMAVIEEWGMLSVKTGEISIKSVMKLVDHLTETA